MADALTERLAAELEIRNVISRLAILADQGELDEYIEQFTDEAVWRYSDQERRGRADILVGARERRSGGVTGPGSNTRHVITNVSVTIEGAERARADSYFLFFQNTTTVPSLFNMGWYSDTFAKQRDRWCLTRREVTFG